MVEYDIPFVCLIFTLLIAFEYFKKKKVNLKENIYYRNVLIFTLCVNSTNFISHYLISTDNSIYMQNIFAIINKIGSAFLIIISINLLAYILYISFAYIRDNIYKFNIFLTIYSIVAGIIVYLLDFNVYNIDGITSGSGSSVVLTFVITLLNLAIAFIIGLINIHKNDKRYNSILFIVPLIFCLGLFVCFHPQFNIYDLIVSLLCYLMYFSIENPDITLINELEIERDRANKANMAKSDFLSSMSHEIRTPLNAIVGLSEDIQNYHDQVPKEVVDDTEDICNASQTLLEIVGNILDISKIESDKLEIIEKPYNFKEEILNIVKIDETRLQDKDIDFNINISSDIPDELIGDKTRVKQIVNNLVTNAIKYTNSGFINFSVKCINDIPNMTTTLYIVCEDSGIGIKKENISKLFTKFERLDIEKNSTTEGTGLGLAITKKLVELMDGKINVSSTYGKGSIFVVKLPQKISKLNNTTTNNIVKENNIFNNYKVLIVDDNKLNIKVAERCMSKLGFICSSSLSGDDAINMCKTNKYDLILMDIMMQNMNGIECFHTLLEENLIDNTKVIALTADALAGSDEKYKSLGFDGYISKPFTKEQMINKLNR